MKHTEILKRLWNAITSTVFLMATMQLLLSLYFLRFLIPSFAIFTLISLAFIWLLTKHNSKRDRYIYISVILLTVLLALTRYGLGVWYRENIDYYYPFLRSDIYQIIRYVCCTTVFIAGFLSETKYNNLFVNQSKRKSTVIRILKWIALVLSLAIVVAYMDSRINFPRPKKLQKEEIAEITRIKELPLFKELEWLSNNRGIAKNDSLNIVSYPNAETITKFKVLLSTDINTWGLGKDYVQTNIEENTYFALYKVDNTLCFAKYQWNLYLTYGAITPYEVKEYQESENGYNITEYFFKWDYRTDYGNRIKNGHCLIVLSIITHPDEVGYELRMLTDDNRTTFYIYKGFVEGQADLKEFFKKNTE